MKPSLGIITLWLTVALSQTVPECTAAMVATDDCAAVIDANACYNEYRFSGAQTLTCIAGTDDEDRARKACKCCGCVGAQMCKWVQQQKLC